MHKIVDKNLRIASCGIGDLTSKLVSEFLGQWEDGATIGSLTMFFERNKGYLVLNADNKDYDFYLELARKYLEADDEEAEAIMERAPERYKETMEILDRFRKYRNIMDEMEMIMHHGLVTGCTHEACVLQAIVERNKGGCASPYILMSLAYRYGQINGKRSERARRKGMQA